MKGLYKDRLFSARKFFVSTIYTRKICKSIYRYYVFLLEILSCQIFHCFIEDIVSSSASYYEMKLVDKVSLPIEGKGKETFKKNIGGLS